MSECQIPGNPRFQDARKCQNARKHQFPGNARIGVFGYIGKNAQNSPKSAYAKVGKIPSEMGK